MASGSVYKPTSLDIISRPNPVEPQSVPQKHPLNGTPQLPQASNKDLLRVLYDVNSAVAGERPAKRRKSGDGKSMDLPKLPVRQSTKRLRIPPTLSGLHQPPPNAGLLPSISIEQPKTPQKAVEPSGAGGPVGDTSATEVPVATHKDAAHGPEATQTKKPRRNKWSDEETACLLKGVAQFGVGNWTKILNCSDYKFETQTALDLKDRFRVCCPDDYQRTKKRLLPRREASATAVRGSRPSRCERKSSAELQDLGINQPFTKTQRRSRRGYSDAEDEALLKGFMKHGSQWSAIRRDQELCLEHRTATDLRDRMRTRFPEQYVNAGLAPRPEIFPQPAKRGRKDGDGSASAPTANGGQPELQTTAPIPASTTKTAYPSMPSEPKRQAQSLLLPDDDVFFGAPFNDDAETERITLDRGILDWPLDSNKVASLDTSKTTTIDPIATLNLPRPTVPQPTGYSALPSLAAITAYSDFDASGQLELPSLMLGSLESDGRGGGHFLGFDEMLS